MARTDTDYLQDLALHLRLDGMPGRVPSLRGASASSSRSWR